MGDLRSNGAQPEPMKAKPGHEYFNEKEQRTAFGARDGTLRCVSKMTPNTWFGADMSSDWKEVEP